MNARERRSQARAARREHVRNLCEQASLASMRDGSWGVIRNPCVPTKMRRVWLPFGGTKHWINEPIKPVNRYLTPVDRAEVGALQAYSARDLALKGKGHK